MTDLSLAAQAVLDAFLGDCKNTGLQMDDLRENVAAALRAAADQLSYSNVPEEFADLRSSVIDTDDLLAIAAELEAHD